jgi:hypothetical protein
MHQTWEAEFLVSAAAKGVPRADVLYVSLCLSRAMGVVVQAMLAAARRWCLNEKDALTTAEALPFAPAEFGQRVRDLLGVTGVTAAELECSIDRAGQLVGESIKAIAGVE